MQLHVRLNEGIQEVVRWERDGVQVPIAAGVLQVRAAEDDVDPVLELAASIADGEAVFAAAPEDLTTVSAALLALTPASPGVWGILVHDADGNPRTPVEGDCTASLGVVR